MIPLSLSLSAAKEEKYFGWFRELEVHKVPWGGGREKEICLDARCDRLAE